LFFFAGGNNMLAMEPIQLTLNLDNLAPDELRYQQMQASLAAMSESMGKVRRKLFGDMSELKNAVAALQLENKQLNEKLRGMNREPTEWLYLHNGSLFDVDDRAII
jgi:hypothetical protein